MISSTLGFIYTPDLQKVLLIEKQRPEFHKGRLNGLGGKCERNEESTTCISREVEEESGLKIPPTEWKNIGSMTWDEWDVEIFVVIYKGETKKVTSLTEGLVQWYSAQDLPKKCFNKLTLVNTFGN